MVVQADAFSDPDFMVVLPNCAETSRLAQNVSKADALEYDEESDLHLGLDELTNWELPDEPQILTPVSDAGASPIDSLHTESQGCLALDLQHMVGVYHEPVKDSTMHSTGRNTEAADVSTISHPLHGSTGLVRRPRPHELPAVDAFGRDARNIRHDALLNEPQFQHIMEEQPYRGSGVSQGMPVAMAWPLASPEVLMPKSFVTDGTMAHNSSVMIEGAGFNADMFEEQRRADLHMHHGPNLVSSNNYHDFGSRSQRLVPYRTMAGPHSVISIPSQAELDMMHQSYYQM